MTNEPDTSIFDDATNTSSAGNDQNSQTPEYSFGDEFKELVGEGRKYKTPEDLAKSRKEADKFIEQLKAEKREKERLLSEKEKELLELKASREFDRELNKDDDADPSEVSVNSIDIDTLKDTVNDLLSQRETETILQSNLKKAETLLVDSFGNKELAKKAFEDKATDLGLSVKELQRLAASSPKAFGKLFEIGQEQNSYSSRGSDINTSAFSKSSKIVENSHAWFKAQEKENPKLLRDNSWSIKKHNAAQKLGEAFFN